MRGPAFVSRSLSSPTVRSASSQHNVRSLRSWIANGTDPERAASRHARLRPSKLRSRHATPRNARRGSVCGHVWHIFEDSETVLRLGHDRKVETALRTWLSQRLLFAVQIKGLVLKMAAAWAHALPRRAGRAAGADRRSHRVRDAARSIGRWRNPDKFGGHRIAHRLCGGHTFPQLRDPCCRIHKVGKRTAGTDCNEA